MRLCIIPRSLSRDHAPQKSPHDQTRANRPPINIFSGQSLPVALNSATTFQGIASPGSLAVGSLINLDLALQPDASYAATRVEVQDAAATNVASGQLNTLPVGMGIPFIYANSTKFQTSARFPNLSALSFPASFSSSTLAAGQRVSIASQSISYTAGPAITAALVRSAETTKML